MREIARSAGAKNVIAVQYHFVDRDGVLQAILDKHLPAVDARRHALLDAAEGEPTLRTMAGALVRPLGAKLADADGGPAFLQVYADLLNRPKPRLSVLEGQAEHGPAGRFGSLRRWRDLVTPLLAPDAAELHPRLAALTYTAVELARRAQSGPHTDDRLFISHLIDLVAALLAAPVSAETQRLLLERGARGRRASNGDL